MGIIKSILSIGLFSAHAEVDLSLSADEVNSTSAISFHPDEADREIVITEPQTETDASETTPKRIPLQKMRAAVVSPALVTTLADELHEPAGNQLSLREALRDAGTGTTITFAPTLDGGLITLNAQMGQLVIDKALTIDASALPNGITIDGGSNGDAIKDAKETRCFFISDRSETKLAVTLNKITIQKGVFEGANAGGNIHNRENLTLIACEISNGCTLGTDAHGGGIYSETGNLTLRDCTVSENQTQGENAQGGGIYLKASNLALTTCKISVNKTVGSSSDGGGIYEAFGNVTLTDCTISGNEAQGSGGGFFNEGGSLALTGCTVSGNQTRGSGLGGGGGVSMFGPLKLSHCTISGNTALDHHDGQTYGGGGLVIVGDTNTMKHCTIVANSTASGSGAGILAFVDGDGDPTLIKISHTIVQDNTGGVDLALSELLGKQAEKMYQFAGENLVGTVGAGISGVTLNLDPILLFPLGNYGGSTETQPPLKGSPVIDAATSSGAKEDQRGFGRDHAPDIGAAEFIPIKVTSLTDRRAL
ncbi:right-handed parallel beta-helix repeat-containing protein [bacterium]|nr:right-handed parallel beta-helix repeat-containing protein [bacterium]